MIVIKYLCLLLAIIYGFSNVAKIIRKQTIYSPQIVFMALGIVGYILLEFELGF